MKKFLVTSFSFACLMAVSTLGAKADHILGVGTVCHIDVDRTTHNIDIDMSAIDLNKPIFIDMADLRGDKDESLEITKIDQKGTFTEVINGVDIHTNCWAHEYKNVFSGSVDHGKAVEIGPLTIGQIPVINGDGRLDPLGTQLRVVWTCYAGFCREQNARVTVLQRDN